MGRQVLYLGRMFAIQSCLLVKVMSIFFVLTGCSSNKQCFSYTSTYVSSPSYITYEKFENKKPRRYVKDEV